MILPNKYISISESLVGLSACILNVLGKNCCGIEYVWERLYKDYVEKNKIRYAPSYSKFILTISYMYLTQMINYNEEGEIFNENIAT